MASLELLAPDGSGRTATIELAPDVTTPEQIKSTADKARAAIPLDAYKSPADAAAKPADAPAAKDTSYASALGVGTSDLEHGIRASAGTIGGVLPDGTSGKQTLSGFGNGKQVFPQPENYDRAAPQVGAAISRGDYGAALRNLPRAAVETIPSMVAALAAGAVAGPVGTAAMIGAQNLGVNAQARASNNNEPVVDGHQTVSGGSLLGSLPATAAQTVLGTAGLRAGRAIPGANVAVRGAADIGGEALAGAANDAVGQIGTSAGTDKGVQFDPAQTAAAGLQAGAARVGTSVAGGAGQAVKYGAQHAAGMAYETPTIEQAQSLQRVNSAVNERIAQVKTASGRTIDFDEAANSLKSELTANVLQIGRSLRDQVGTSVDSDTFNRVIAPAIDQAMRHNKELGTSADGEAETSFSRLQALDLPEEIKAPLVSGLRDLSLLSQASRKNRMAGPAENVGKLIGTTVGVGGGIVTGGVTGGIMALGHSIPAFVGGRVGRVIDTALGTRSPEVVLRAERAAKVLKDAGVDAGTNPLTATNAALDTLRDPQSSLIRALNLNNAASMQLPEHFRSMTAASANALPDPLKQGLADTVGLPKDILQSHLDNGLSPQEIGNLSARARTDLGPAAFRAVLRAHSQAILDDASRQTQALKEAEAAKTAQTAALDKADARARTEKAKQDAVVAAMARTRDRADQRAEQQRSADEGRFSDEQRRQQQTEQAATAAASRSTERETSQFASDKEAALARNERAADWVSGVAHQNGEDVGAAARANLFETSGGQHGSPAEPSDPLVRHPPQSPSTSAPPLVPHTASDVAGAVSQDGAGASVAPDPHSAAAAQIASLRASLEAHIQHAAPGKASEALSPPPMGHLPQGWVSFIQRGIDNAHGVKIDPNNIIGAVRSLVAKGELDPLIGEQLVSHSGSVPGNSPEMQAVSKEAMRLSGLGHRVIGGTGAGEEPSGAPSGPTTIRDLPRWFAARDDVKAHVDNVAAHAERQDDHPLAAVVRQIGAAQTARDKQDIKTKFLKGLKGERLVRAVTTLDDPTLLRGTGEVTPNGPTKAKAAPKRQSAADVAAARASTTAALQAHLASKGA